MTEPVDVEEIKTQINAIVKNPVYSDRVVALIPVYGSLDALAAERDALKASCIDHMNTIGELTQDVEKLKAEVEELIGELKDER